MAKMNLNAKKLHELRAERGLSYEALAAKAGISRSSAFLAERAGYCSARSIGLLAKALEVEPVDLQQVDEVG